MSLHAPRSWGADADYNDCVMGLTQHAGREAARHRQLVHIYHGRRFRPISSDTARVELHNSGMGHCLMCQTHTPPHLEPLTLTSCLWSPMRPCHDYDHQWCSSRTFPGWRFRFHTTAGEVFPHTVVVFVGTPWSMCNQGRCCDGYAAERRCIVSVTC